MIATYFVAFDTRTPPFNDVKWRRRFSAAVDRQGIIQALGSNEFPALSWIPRGLEGALETTNLPPLLLTAKKESTPQSGAKIPPVTLTYDSSGRNSLIVEKIQNDVQRTTGLRIILEPADWKTHVRRMREDPRHIYRFGWLAPFVDPISHLRAFTSDNPNNYTGWKDSTYDALVEKIARTPRGPAREALIRQADRRLVEEEAVVVPIYHYVQDYGVSQRIKGFRAAPNGVIRFAEMSL
jgi:oligopeptide transport system substrate-binding protein